MKIHANDTYRVTLMALALSVALEVRGAFVVPENMVRIPAGVFVMGTPQVYWGIHTFERPQTTVTLTLTFYMSRHEVTQNEFLSLMGTNPSRFQTSSRGNCPVEYVHWNEVVAYCERLTLREKEAGRLPEGWVYRLPTEAEWEYACRAGTTTAFHYGDGLYSGMAAFDGRLGYNVLTGPTNDTNGIRATQPVAVGSYTPNAWGLYDMHGNVAEICLDFWTNYLSGGSVFDPQTTVGTYRIARGGSWQNTGIACKSSSRTTQFMARHNAIGFRVVLAPINTAWRRAIEARRPAPTYTAAPEKLPGKDSLIVVTHGWNPNTNWVIAMTNDITRYLSESGKDNWQVHAHMWVEKARISAARLGFETVLYRARGEGNSLGISLGSSVWDHVHFIGHSAGAALIQAAATGAKKVSSTISIHTTFLDPYVGFTFGGTEKYGEDSDWSDHYFTTDEETSDGYLSRTDSLLKSTYNVDVARLDQSRERVGVFMSALITSSPNQVCYVPKTSHAWPYMFYAGTIPPSTLTGSEGFGFPLSKEGGNWDYATNTYPVGINSLKTLGAESEPYCVPVRERTVFTSPRLQLQQLKTMESDRGRIDVQDYRVMLSTANGGFSPAGDEQASPIKYAWVMFETLLTNRINRVSFEVDFGSSAGLSNLLTVLCDTNEVVSIDGRLASPGFQRYGFEIADTRSVSTACLLGFRLDSFDSTDSSVVITNISFGFVGVMEPFTIAHTGTQFEDRDVFELQGPNDYNYVAEVSTNLFDWRPFAILVNTNGTVRFTDPHSPAGSTRFYRISAQ